MSSDETQFVPEFPHLPLILKPQSEREPSVAIIQLDEQDLPSALRYMNWSTTSKGAAPTTMTDVMRIAANGAPPLSVGVASVAVRKPSKDALNRGPQNIAQELKIRFAFNGCPLFVRTLGARLENPDGVAPITVMPAYAGTLYALLDQLRRNLSFIPQSLAAEHWLRDLMLDAFKATAIMHLHELAHRDLTGMNILFSRTHRGGFKLAVGGFSRVCTAGQAAVVSVEGKENKSFKPMALDSSRGHTAHIVGTYWWASIEALLCVDVDVYDTRAVDVFALAINILGPLLGGVSHYGRSTPADQVVYYFANIAEYDHELWGSAVDNLAVAFPQTCGDLAARLADITFSPFYASFDGYCPDLIDLLRRMLAPNPFERPAMPEVLRHPWFAGCDTALPHVAIGDELLAMPDTDEDAIAYIRASCQDAFGGAIR